MSNHILDDFPPQSAALQLPINQGDVITNDPAEHYTEPHRTDSDANWSSAPSQDPRDPYLAAASEGLFGADWSFMPSQAPQGPHLTAVSEDLFGVHWPFTPSQISQGTPQSITQHFAAPIPAALTQNPPCEQLIGQRIIYDIPQHTAAFSVPVDQAIVTMPGSSALQATGENRIRCPKGCPRTFRRAGDYRRHMKKHEDPIFKCVAIECDKKFYRLDKLRSHVKGHGINL